MMVQIHPTLPTQEETIEMLQYEKAYTERHDIMLSFKFDIRFSYPRTGVCVSTLAITEQSTNEVLTLEGISKCHPDDQFVKAAGRLMALRRSTAKINNAIVRSEFRSILKRTIFESYFAREFTPTLFINEAIVEAAINANYR